MARSEEGPSPRPVRPPIPWSGVFLISLAAAILIAANHLIPGKPPLSHMDFVPGGPDAVEFCDPQNPRIIAVAAKPASVTLGLAPAAPLRAGSPEPARVRLELRTASGRAVGPDDLVSSAGGWIRLFILGANLADFQTAQPAPAAMRGAWEFDFVPKMAGVYRVFADMTPLATGREIYASADLRVPGSVPRMADGFSTHAESGGFGFELQPSERPLYAHRKASLRFTIAGTAGSAVPLTPFQGSYARVAIFDEARTAFLSASAPAGGDGPAPDALRPSFDFAVSFPDPGRYVAWVQVDVAGRQTEVPLAVDVTP